MFNSKKSDYTNHLENTTLPMVNDTCNGVPKITSTPLNPRHGQLLRRSSVLLSPTKSTLITPRRYSLSEANPPTNKSGIRIQEAHSPGPLLASLSFKDNVSMYEETKSSGLARRIVLYNEEAEQERQPTHQEKYHSPGLFPIVHLFKKKPPPLEQSPKRVKIKLSSPDYLKNHFPQERSKFLEGLARPRILNQHNLSSSNRSNDTGTKSVLDALKEISRKRIHSNEECDINEDSGKRIRTELELHNGTPTTSKRNRADSPLLDSSESPPPKQSQKKFCVYDEFAASKSSSDFSFLNKTEPPRSKRKTISTSTESLKEKETKQVKLINAETQTIPSIIKSKTKSVQSDEYDNQKTKKRETALKVFDDAPLDRIRKNRLAALMGNLAGKEAYLLPKPSTLDSLSNEPNESLESIDKFKELDTVLAPKFSMTTQENPNETDVTNKPLMSILSPSKTTKELSPLKSEKHVHFTIPGTTQSLTFNQTLLTQTSASIVTPIVSPSISNSSTSSDAKENAGFPCTVSSANLNSIPSTSNLIASTLFQNQGSSVSDTQTSSVIVSSSSPSFSFSKPVQTSSQESVAVPKLSFEAPKTPSPQKLGGFKFELKAPSTADDKSATPTLTYSNSSIVNRTTGSTSLASANSTTFAFVKPIEPKDSTFNFGAAKVNNDITAEPTFSFGGGLSKSQPFAHIQTAAKLPSINSTTSAGFSFGSTENTSMFGTNTTSVSEPSTFTTLASSNYGSQTISSVTRPNFSFTQNTPTTTNSAMFAFGNATAVTSSSGLGIKPPPSFGTNSNSTTSSSMFGNAGATVVAGFGNVPTTTTTPVFGGITTTSASVFGNSSVTSFGTTPVTSAPIFGSTPNPSNSVFGPTPVTSTVIFGNTTVATPAFGSSAITSTSVFGSTNASAASGFGVVTPTTTSSVFGTNNSSFGSNMPATAPIFGSSSTKTPAFGSSSGFGAANTQAPTFGSNSTPDFGNSLHPKSMFGPSTPTTNPPAYGSNTFGGSTTSTSTTTSAPVFGASNPSFSFGSNKPTANVFGSVTTASSNTFGSNTFSSSTGFDQSSGFANNNTQAFGGSTTPSNAFGATSAPAFGGQADNKTVFSFGSSAESKTNPTFGSGSGNSAFGKPTNNTQSGFGSSTGGFGTASTGGFNSHANGGFNFGSNAASPPAPFAFGGSSGGAEPPKPTFNFTGGAANPPAFGSTSGTPSFGSANQSFGTPSFGAPQQAAAGVFNIGAGPNNGRPRTQLRAKRRT